MIQYTDDNDDDDDGGGDDDDDDGDDNAAVKRHSPSVSLTCHAQLTLLHLSNTPPSLKYSSTTEILLYHLNTFLPPKYTSTDELHCIEMYWDANWNTLNCTAMKRKQLTWL